MKTLNLVIKSDIHTRDEIRNLFNFDVEKDLDNVSTIMIDMLKCSFLSRSPAHELVRQAKKLKSDYNISVQFKSLNYEVEKMINVVSSSLQNAMKEKQLYDFFAFKDKKQLFDELEKM
ncbi:MAG: hypothetical protein B6I20_06770 [Bacteroidetes bacterium 4572_117]|nr:MAG: hypothetical protein B6I20_06770 [Bacteroidetes bacterium 4572_117]